MGIHPKRIKGLLTPEQLYVFFDAKVSPEPMSGCWLWTACTTPGGYGMFSDQINERRVVAHRFNYERYVSKIPVGMDLDHLCRVRCCVNPQHLEVVTRRENLRRGIGSAVTRARNLSRTHCKRGHVLTLGNCEKGSRGCRLCANDRQRLAKRIIRGSKREYRPRVFCKQS